jgi:hypothetical protein
MVNDSAGNKETRSDRALFAVLSQNMSGRTEKNMIKHLLGQLTSGTGFEYETF